MPLSLIHSVRSTVRFGQPLERRPAGRAHWLIISTLVIISSLWLGADHLTTPAANQTAPGAIAQAKNQADDARAAAASAIEELQVTAPRLSVPEFTFEEPALELALAKPEAPARHWSNSDS